MLDRTGGTRHTVALADDHPVVRAGLRSLLEADPSLAGVAEDAGLPGIRPGLPGHPPDLLVADRQPAVLRLIAAGDTNAAIARLLCLRLRTVEPRRGQIRAKPNLDSRAELSHCAHAHGLV